MSAITGEVHPLHADAVEICNAALVDVAEWLGYEDVNAYTDALGERGREALNGPRV